MSPKLISIFLSLLHFIFSLPNFFSFCCNRLACTGHLVFLFLYSNSISDTSLVLEYYTWSNISLETLAVNIVFVFVVVVSTQL